MTIIVVGTGLIKVEDGTVTLCLEKDISDTVAESGGFTDESQLTRVAALLLAHISNEHLYDALEMSSYLSQDAYFIRYDEAATLVHRSGIIVAVEDWFSVWYSHTLLHCPNTLKEFVSNEWFINQSDSPYRLAARMWAKQYAVEEIEQRLINS